MFISMNVRLIDISKSAALMFTIMYAISHKVRKCERNRTKSLLCLAYPRTTCAAKAGAGYARREKKTAYSIGDSGRARLDQPDPS